MEKTVRIALWQLRVHTCTHTPHPYLRAGLQLMKTLYIFCVQGTHPFMGRLEVKMVSLCEISRNIIQNVDFEAQLSHSLTLWIASLPLPEKFLQHTTWKRAFSPAISNWTLKVSSVLHISCTVTKNKCQNWDNSVGKRTRKRLGFLSSNIISAELIKHRFIKYIFANRFQTRFFFSIKACFKFAE